MIPITKDIHRLTPDEHDGRKLIVTLGPPNVVTLRPQGLRKDTASITAGDLWKLLREPSLPSLAPRAFSSAPPLDVYPSNVGDVPVAGGTTEARPIASNIDLATFTANATARLRSVLFKRGSAHTEVLKIAEEALVWALDLSLFQSGQITEAEWKARAARYDEPSVQ